METLIYREGGKQPIDRSGLRFGMREISTTTNKFILNGKPIYVRCMGDMALYLDTIAPPVDINWYLPKLKRARDFGINMGKVCVETWSQDFVEAADEAGIMLIQEMPFGVGPVLRANRYTIDQEFRNYFSTELDGLVKQSRNHASVVSYSMSSELEFGQPDPGIVQLLQPGTYLAGEEAGPARAGHRLHRLPGLREDHQGRPDHRLLCLDHPDLVQGSAGRNGGQQRRPASGLVARVELVELLPRPQRQAQIQGHADAAHLVRHVASSRRARTARRN